MTTHYENNIKLIFLLAIYLLFGLAIVSLCIKAVQMQIQITLENIGTKLLRDLVEFLRQMGFHELSTDEILSMTNHNSYSASPSTTDFQHSRQQRSARSTPSMLEYLSPPIPRPIGIAEPVRRLSGSHATRMYKNLEGDINTDKSVQVNTIIRACGRCAGSTPSPTTSMASIRKPNTVSAPPSSPGEISSGCEDEDVRSPTLAPTNLDRLRQRRATLVAKTIISHMATQPAALAVDEPVPSLTLLSVQRSRPPDTSASSTSKYANKKSADLSSDTLRKRDITHAEFVEISKQISSLLTPSDDEN